MRMNIAILIWSEDVTTAASQTTSSLWTQNYQAFQSQHPKVNQCADLAKYILQFCSLYSISILTNFVYCYLSKDIPDLIFTSHKPSNKETKRIDNRTEYYFIYVCLWQDRSMLIKLSMPELIRRVGVGFRRRILFWSFYRRRWVRGLREGAGRGFCDI